MRTYWTEEKLHRLSAVLIIAFTLALSMASFVKVKSPAILNYGDFLAFYSAARILDEGPPEDLYNWERQEEIQSEYFDTEEHGFSPYAYPPFVACMVKPLTHLPPLYGKALFALIMFLALGLSVRVAASYAPILEKDWLVTAAFILCFLPVSMGSLGAQNIALSMLFYSLALRAISQGTGRGDFIAGLWLGFWLFKPHYPLVFISFLALSGSGAAVAGFLIAGGILFGLGSLAADMAWLPLWLQAAFQFSEADFVRNAGFMISIGGFLRALSNWFSSSLFSAQAARVGAGAVSFVLFAWLALKFLALRQIRVSGERVQVRLKLFLLAAPVVLLISPHTLYYDIGLCILACAPLVSLKSDEGVTKLILVLLTVAVSMGLRHWLPVQPLFFATLGVFVYLYQRLGTGSLSDTFPAK